MHTTSQTYSPYCRVIKGRKERGEDERAEEGGMEQRRRKEKEARNTLVGENRRGLRSGAFRRATTDCPLFSFVLAHKQTFTHFEEYFSCGHYRRFVLREFLSFSNFNIIIFR
jgi:hypothetical protein